MSASTVQVVVVGAGIAGLATAHELSRHGASFVVLERASRAGGVIFSEEIDGFTVLRKTPDGWKRVDSAFGSRRPLFG